MFTESALLKAKIDLYNITANFSMQDYKQANINPKTGKRKSKKHIPYTLGQETEQAREMYNLVFGKSPEDIIQEEERIKGYLLIFRLNRTKYLEEAGGTNYYRNSLEKTNLS